MVQIIKNGKTYADTLDVDQQVRATVEGMLDDVKERGDTAIRELSTRLDKWSPKSFRLSAEEIQDIIKGLPEQVISDISILN